ncbi:RsmB/NOP family class I SAM-dependent RNA methyltransferase [Euzebya sp.]|uniref:RsmB/NOP family class I SAM-dependent RNA methyltransferase n=1 Tax=Euzebya sp. TaxID=1971409 RepID=UPI00351390DD
MSDPQPGSDPQAQGTASRRTALTALRRIHDQQAWASPVVDAVLGESGLDARDRSFAANLTFSTLRVEGTLDWILSHLVSRGLDAVEDDLLDILRLGTWELRFGAAPSRAVVNAWVEVARQVVGQRATGFANGVLRGVARRADDLPWPDEATDEGLGLRLGYPAWMVALARQRFGDPRARAVLEAGNTPAPLVLRAVADRDAVIAALTGDGIAAAPGALSPHAVVLAERHVPGDLAVVRDGLAVVQDQASQVVGVTAAEGLPAGAHVIDLCAAPGGKSTHLAQQGLTVTAVDRHPGRLRRVAALADGLGMAVTTLAADGIDPGLPEGQADAVLLDAPCSGLGVVRRRPELRWRKTPDDVDALARTQVDLLASAVRLVRPGGRVTYSVCTWTEAETDLVVDAVRSVAAVRSLRPPAVGTPTRCGTQLAPDLDDGDGMFVAAMLREG